MSKTLETARPQYTIGTMRFRPMTGEAEPEEGYIAVYEVIVNETESFGTLDRAVQGNGNKHKLESWDKEHVWHFGYARNQWARRVARWIERNAPEPV